ncbi:MAG TPA: hypothetical protein VHA73_13730 [Acidimicrobiales bacterium]|nr:hypothetical protein [Acidimicrobiales bacterium]
MNLHRGFPSQISGSGGRRCGGLHVFRCNTSLDAVARLRADQIALVQYCDGAARPSSDPITDSRCLREMPGEGNFPSSASSKR